MLLLLIWMHHLGYLASSVTGYKPARAQQAPLWGGALKAINGAEKNWETEQ